MSTNPEEAPKPAPQEKTEIVWWHMFLAGALFFAGAAFVYWYISDLEQGGRGGRIHWLLAILYKWGGKWLCVGFVALFGVAFTAAGIVALVKKAQVNELEDEEEAA